MGSLRDLAQRVLTPVERPLEQDLEHLEHPVPAFQTPSDVPGTLEHHKRQKTAKNAACSSVPAPIAWNSGTLEDLAAELGRTPCPSRVDPANWREVIVDARRLISDGWAEKALKLGWGPLDLFGAVTDPVGDPHSDGLAVWLSGRTVIALTKDVAVVLKGEMGRSYFLRPRAPGAALIWELGR